MTFELIGTRIHPEDLSVFQEHIERSRRDGSDVQLEFRLQMPDGAVKYVHVVAHTRGDHGELEYIGAVQDVTERRSSEEALSKARSELSHVARVTSLGVLTASIAHEVNQPLSGIVTNASTCLRMLAADPPNVDGARETARRTIRDGNRASEVITRLRALYGKKDPTIESVDLNEATTRGDCAVLERTSEKPGDPAAGTCRRPSSGHRRSCPVATSHPEPDPECIRRDEQRRRSSEAVADQNRTKRRRSCASHRAGCGSRFRPSSGGQTFRIVLHH